MRVGWVLHRYQGVKGHELEQSSHPGVQVILDPPTLKTGALKYPYSSAAR